MARKWKVNKCTICNWHGSVDCHHIDGNHSNNAKCNKVYLCPNCHRRATTGEIINLRWCTTSIGRQLYWQETNIGGFKAPILHRRLSVED